MCLRVLKERNKSRFDRYSRQTTFLEIAVYEINPPFPFPPETPDTQAITTAKHKLTALLTLLERYMASLFFSLSLTLFCQLQHFGGLV